MKEFDEKGLTDLICSKLQELNLESRVRFGGFSFKNSHLTIDFHGGLNGCCKWANYLKEISKIIEAFEGSWLVSLVNDCPDDLWYLTIGWLCPNIKDFVPTDFSDFDKDHEEGLYLIRVGQQSYVLHAIGEPKEKNYTYVYEVLGTDTDTFKNLKIGQGINVKSLPAYQKAEDMYKLSDMLRKQHKIDIVVSPLPESTAYQATVVTRKDVDGKSVADKEIQISNPNKAADDVQANQFSSYEEAMAACHHYILENLVEPDYSIPVTENKD